MAARYVLMLALFIFEAVPCAAQTGVGGTNPAQVGLGVRVAGITTNVISFSSSRVVSNGVSPRGQHSTSCEFSATTKSSLLVA